MKEDELPYNHDGMDCFDANTHDSGPALCLGPHGCEDDHCAIHEL
jgi:hypothetical protein